MAVVHDRHDRLSQCVARGETAFVLVALEVVVGCAIGDLQDALKLRGVQSGREQLLHRRDRRAGCRQVAAERRLDLLQEDIRRRDQRGEIRDRDVHGRRAVGLHLVDRALHHGSDLRVFGRAAEILRQDAHARAFERRAFE